MILTSALADFEIACRAAGLTPKTVRWYMQMLAAWSIFVGDRDFCDPGVTRAFIAALQGRTERYAAHPKKHPEPGGLSPDTIRAHLRAIRRFFNWLIADGRLADNPAKRTQMPKRPKRLPRAIERPDFERLLAAATCERDRAVLFFLRDTGCRVGELCGLRVRDVDLSRGQAFVVGKGTRERYVFLRPKSCAALRKYLDGRGHLAPGDAVFVNLTDSKACRTSTIEGAVRRLATRAKVIGRCNPHSFRHAFGRDWVISGGDIAPLADVLGHDDIETTKIYLRFKVAELKEMHRRHSPLGDEED